MSFQIKPTPGLDQSTMITLDLDVIVGIDSAASKVFIYDGAAKTEYTTALPSDKNIRMVVGNGTYVAIEMSTQFGYMEGPWSTTSLVTNKVYHSTDAIMWTAADLPGTWAIKDLQFLNGKFYVTGHPASTPEDSYVIASLDGDVWTTVLTSNTSVIFPISSPVYSPNFSKIAYGNGKLVVAARVDMYGMGYSYAYQSSDNGVTWSATPIGSAYSNGVNYAFGAFVYGNGYFLLLDRGSAQSACFSKDAITWTQAAGSHGAQDIVVHNNAFYVPNDYGVSQYRFYVDISMGGNVYLREYRSKEINGMTPNYPTYPSTLVLKDNTLYFSYVGGTAYKSTILNKLVDPMMMVYDVWTTTSELGGNLLLVKSTGAFKKNLSAFLKSLL